MGESNANGIEAAIQEGQDQQKEYGDCCAFFGFAPIPFFQRQYHRCRKYGCKGEIDRGKKRMLCFTRSIWNSACLWRFVTVCEALIVGAAAVYSIRLWGRDELTTERAVAAFTAAMVWTTLRAWIAMHTQNNIMLRQMEQTDELIKNSRLSQRPWFVVRATKFDPPQSDKPFVCTVTIQNVGETPGTFTKFRFGAFPVTIEESHIDTLELKEGFEENRIFQTWIRNWVIAPSGTMNYDIGTPMPLAIDDIARLARGFYKIRIYGEIEYLDIFLDKHITEFQFIYKEDGKVYTDHWRNRMT